jgi:hypothetical protein
MAENIFQSIRGAQFRGSRFPGFRSTGQQADSGVDPVTAELAAQSGGGSRPSTGLNAQSFGGSDFTASTAPTGPGAPNGGPNLAGVGQTISNTVQNALPDFTTTGDKIATGGRVIGSLISGIPGLVVSGGAQLAGRAMNVDEYNNQLERTAIGPVVSNFSWNSPKEQRDRAIEQFEKNVVENPNFSNVNAAPKDFNLDNLVSELATRSEVPTSDYVAPNTEENTPTEQPITAEGPTASIADAQAAADASSQGSSAGASVDSPSANGSTTGGEGNYGYAKGGHVTADRLKGPNPPGPDDGYAALDVGETVITAEATRRYGKDVMMALNKGLVSREAVRRLLG